MRGSRVELGAAFALVLALGACSSGKDAADAPDAPDSPGTGGSGAVSAACPGNGDDATGSGTITGSASGHAVDSVAAARWIGAPDSASTTVVYVFSEPVACAELCATGWDARVADGTQIVELTLFGTAPGTFAVVKTATPAAGEASVNTTLTTNGSADERSASGGTAELSTLTPKQSVQGGFALEFGSESLTGTFDAAYCPGAHEP